MSKLNHAVTSDEAVKSTHGAGSALQYVYSDVDALRSFARRDNLAPETMLVDLKHTLDAVSELDRLEPERREETRSRVVQNAIREYFADGEVR